MSADPAWLAGVISADQTTIAKESSVTNKDTVDLHPALSLILALVLTMPFAANGANAANAERQAEVARRGKEVMPFDLQSTTHVFTKTAEGGVQRIVAKDGANPEQVKMARAHLAQIRREFLAGDFSGPRRIHGDDMPGLADLRTARRGAIAIDYRDVEKGGELIYRTADLKLAHALHAWFDAQLSDHGADAVEGHQHPMPPTSR
jgi:hypothetical protein